MIKKVAAQLLLHCAVYHEKLSLTVFRTRAIELYQPGMMHSIEITFRGHVPSMITVPYTKSIHS